VVGCSQEQERCDCPCEPEIEKGSRLTERSGHPWGIGLNGCNNWNCERRTDRQNDNALNKVKEPDAKIPFAEIGKAAERIGGDHSGNLPVDAGGRSDLRWTMMPGMTELGIMSVEQLQEGQPTCWRGRK